MGGVGLSIHAWVRDLQFGPIHKCSKQSKYSLGLDYRTELTKPSVVRYNCFLTIKRVSGTPILDM